MRCTATTFTGKVVLIRVHIIILLCYSTTGRSKNSKGDETSPQGHIFVPETQTIRTRCYKYVYIFFYDFYF